MSARILAVLMSCVVMTTPLGAQVADRQEPNRGAALDLASQDPKVALERMKIAEGYAINLFASEVEFPDLRKPLAMTFDTRGRLCEGCTPRKRNVSSSVADFIGEPLSACSTK